MAAVVRLTRLGQKGRPFYRIIVIDRRARRDGRYLENLGTYDPLIKDPKTRITLKTDRYQYWLGVGAKPSETVERLVKHVM